MKAVILAGGMGTRLAEETDLIPKPMVEIGDRPILLHIMHHYAHHGITDFVIALGYKGNVIKRYMLDYHLMNQPGIRVELGTGDAKPLDHTEILDWRVDLQETGLHTMTAGRVRRCMPLVGDETFMLTYGDGVSDVDLTALLEFHRSHGRLATLTVVRAKSLYGHMEMNGDAITSFLEKPQSLSSWINGGFMVVEPGIAEYLGHDDGISLERGPLENLASDGELMAYHHEGFWQCMDSLREKRLLEDLWREGDPPWRSWG
ncbi:MAG: glucose-1-phosphate cytidylyltransferase [Acidimicrobiia bacterium]|nr:glucose-1-phosphate cytidylyltransferase [Acidimicrobiia bacterium]